MEIVKIKRYFFMREKLKIRVLDAFTVIVRKVVVLQTFHNHKNNLSHCLLTIIKQSILIYSTILLRKK